MHDLGDNLLQTTFVDPVMDVEYFTLLYSEALDQLTLAKGVLLNDNALLGEISLQEGSAYGINSFPVLVSALFCHPKLP